MAELSGKIMVYDTKILVTPWEVIYLDRLSVGQMKITPSSNIGLRLIRGLHWSQKLETKKKQSFTSFVFI